MGTFKVWGLEKYLISREAKLKQAKLITTFYVLTFIQSFLIIPKFPSSTKNISANKYTNWFKTQKHWSLNLCEKFDY